MFHDLESPRRYHAYRAKELYRRAKQERLAQLIRSERKHFYDPALAQVGRWLMIYGLRLHQRYGENHHPHVSHRHVHLYAEGVES